jgi:hypothetical protein
MPDLVVEIAALIYFYLGASIATSIIIAQTLLSLVPTLLLGAISKMFQKGASSSSLISQAASRTVTWSQGFEE